MGWQDRDYSRTPSGGGWSVLNWLLTGSVPLFRVFGISVRMHAAFLVMVALWLLFGFGPGTPLVFKLQVVAVLWTIIILHEFGHCFGARWTGGSAELITLNPLGGLAYAMAAHNPFSQTVTVAAGPAVNVIICIITGSILLPMTGDVPLTPWSGFRGFFSSDWATLLEWVMLFHSISLGLLYFNLLPIFPLDGGQLLHAILWRPMGYYKAMWITVHIGLVGASLLILYGLIGVTGFGGGLMLFIGINCLLNCIQWRAALKQTDPYSFESYMAEGGIERARVHTQRQDERESQRRAKARAREQEEERREKEEVDRILAKVAEQGMNSLSSREKKALARATENQIKRDQEREKRVRASW